ncbi:MAG: FtsX-like permease family protein [Euryarchaeota archaeon]|nr:FtsX-like permease family protein [Euryarchaeota archaeon]
MKARSYVLRGLGTNKRRYALGAASIVLSTMIMITIGVVFAGAQVELRGFYERAYAYDFEVAGARAGFNATLFEAAPVVSNVTAVDGVTGAYPVLATVLFAHSNLTGGNRPVLVYGAEQSYTAGNVRSLSGRYDLSPGMAVLTKSAARKFGASVGGTLTLRDLLGPNGTAVNVTVAGIAELEGRFPPSLTEYVVTGFGFLGESLDRTGQATSVMVRIQGDRWDFGNPADPVGQARAVGTEIARSLGPRYTVTSYKAYLIEAGIQGTSFLGIMIYVFSAFFPAVAGILVASILNLSVEDKAHDLAVIRLLGARRGTVARILLLELGMILLIGLPLGVILGILVPYAYLPAFLAKANPATVATTIGVQLSISVAVLLAFAVKPLQRAFRASPVDAVRRTRAIGELRFRQDGGIDRRIPLSGFLTFLAVAYSALVIPYILIFSDVEQIVFYLLISVMVMLICLSVGMLLFATRLETALVAATRPATEKFNMLARRSIVRYARRNLSTNVIFGVVVAILVFFTSLISSVRGSIEDAARYESGADIRVRSAFEMPQSEFDQMLQIKDVAEGAGVGPPLQVELGNLVGPSGQKVQLLAADRRLPGASYMSGADFFQGGPADFDLKNESIIISRSVASALDVGLGDRLRVDQETRRSFLTVAAVLNSLPGFTFQVSQSSRNAVFDYQAAFVSFEQWRYLANRSVAVNTYTNLFLKVAPGANASRVGEEVMARFADVEGFQVSVTQESIRTVRFYTGYLDLVFTAVLLGMMMVAVFSLMSNLYASIKEREFELGVLRAVGFRRSQILASLMTEGLAVALSSVILGIIVGMVVGWVMVWFIGLLSDIGFRFVMPLEIIGLVLAVTVIASAVGVALTSRSVVKKPLIDLIKRTE